MATHGMVSIHKISQRVTAVVEDAEMFAACLLLIIPCIIIHFLERKKLL